MRLQKTGFPLTALACLCLLLQGCAQIPYTYSRINEPEGAILRPGDTQVDRGRPVKFVDFIGHYIFSLPSKLILWNWKVENHKISPETERILNIYLADNQLSNVKVRLNQYAPGGEWRRLFKNRTVGAGWRYTIGFISVLFYTIFPGRVFGGDAYNPYTNTIYLYSDLPEIALHEGAHAKDFAIRKHRAAMPRWVCCR